VSIPSTRSLAQFDTSSQYGEGKSKRARLIESKMVLIVASCFKM
jgi:hypothetical protein